MGKITAKAINDYMSSDEQQRRIASYQENASVLSSFGENPYVKDEEERKKYQKALIDFQRDSNYLSSMGMLDKNTATLNTLYSQGNFKVASRLPDYDTWGQSTGNQNYLNELTSQLNDLQSQLEEIQNRSISSKNGFSMLNTLYTEGEPIRQQIDEVKGKITNTLANVKQKDPTVAYYEGRTSEQLLEDRKTIEEMLKRNQKEDALENAQTGWRTQENRDAYARKNATYENYLNIIDSVLADREREEQYENYISMLDDERGYYDVTVDKNDRFYQAVNGRWSGDTMGGALYYDEAQFEEMTDEERRIYNAIYKKEGSAKAMEFFDFLQKDLNLRNRIKTEAAAVEFAKENPVMASAASSLMKLASPMTAIRQLADVFTEGEVDQNAPYNFTSWSAKTLRDTVMQDIRADKGEFWGWTYQVGMSVADNLLQMAATGGNQALVLALMGSSVFADSIVEGKDAGKSEAEIIATATVRAAIEIATEKIGLDNIFKFAEQGGLKNLLAAVLSEGGEEGISNIGNLFYDNLVEIFKGNESAIKQEVDQLISAGFSESDAIGQVVAEKMKDLGLDILSGAVSGFALSGGAYVGENGITLKRAINTTLDEVVDVGLSLDSDSDAYKFAQAVDRSKTGLAAQLQKVQQIKLNDAETRKEFSETVEEYREIFRNTNIDDIMDVYLQARGSASSEVRQWGIAQALEDTFQEMVKDHVRSTNPTVKTANANDVTQILRFRDPTARLGNGEIVRVGSLKFDNEDLKDVFQNATKGLKKTSYANDYISQYKSLDKPIPANSYDTLFKTTLEMGKKDATLEEVLANEKVSNIVKAYNDVDFMPTIQVALADGKNAAFRVTEGEREKITKVGKDFGYEVKFVDGLKDEKGRSVQGKFEKPTKTIYISTTTSNPATMVFCHELTHAMEQDHKAAYEVYKNRVLEMLKRDEASYENRRDEIADLYGWDRNTEDEAEKKRIEREIDSELVAIASENYLIDESFVNSLKDNKSIFRQLRNTIIDKYRLGAGDYFRTSLMNSTMEDTNFFEELGRIWIDSMAGAEITESNVDLIKEEAGIETESDIDTDFSENKYSIAAPFRGNALKEWLETLSPEARETYDLFATVKEIGKRFKGRNWTTKYMLASEWNDMVAEGGNFAKVAKDIADAIPEEARKSWMNEDGTIIESPFEKEFKMQRSIMQRLVDRLPMTTVEPYVTIDGQRIRVSDKEKIYCVGGEQYRQALYNARLDLWKEGKLPTRKLKGLRKDTWGTLGFIATNTKTEASGDFTTFCPQMYFNKGCFYCYRRAALESGVNNKLVGENVWYTGELLQISQEDIEKLKKMGGLRIQSFGDWMDRFSPQLAQVLADADRVGLPVKIITKEPSMIDVVAKIKDAGIGKSLYFNLSSDYSIERAGSIEVEKAGGAATQNPMRPYMRDEKGEMWWKRALTPEEADEYRQKYPWVNTRIVATTVEEFIRGLKSPIVDVVTGYHGKIREYERISSETGETILQMEAFGDAGMPRFHFDYRTQTWETEDEGKNKIHKILAQRIVEEGLQYEYFIKSCCITGRCASCVTRCGLRARSFNIMNATNRDAESVAYWKEDMINPKELLGESTEQLSRDFGDGTVQIGNRAVMKESRIDDLIADSGAGSRTDYARKWITSINPSDFINMTTRDSQSREKFDTMPGSYGETNQTDDYTKWLKESPQTPFLSVVYGTGEVVGHEGRHRMRALEMAGITSAEIAIEFYSEEGYLLKEANGYGNPLTPVESLEISNQFETGQTVTIGNIIPLNKSTKDLVMESYGEAHAEENDISYSVEFDSTGMDLTDEQISYFKDSKARDALGHLKQYFHGTRSGGFTVFNSRYSNDRLSLFFTDNPAVADSYTYKLKNEDVPSYTRGNYGIMRYPVYLNITNPMIIDAKGANWSAIQNGETESRTADRKTIGDFTFLSQNDYDYFNEKYGFEELQKLYDLAKSDGSTVVYDGEELDEWEVEEKLEDAFRMARKEYVQYYRNNSKKITFRDFFENPNAYGWWGLEALIDAFDSNAMGAFEARDEYEYSLEELSNIWKEQFQEDIDEGNVDDTIWDMEFNALPLTGEDYTVRDLHNTRWYARQAKENGYDGVIIKNVHDSVFGSEASEVVIAFDSNQIKSVDNANPTEDPDIDYSREFENPEETDALTEDVAKALKGIDVSNVNLADAQVEKIAERILRGLHSRYPKTDLVRNLKGAFRYWVENENVDYAALKQVMADVMVPVVEQIYTVDSIRTTAIAGKTFIISEDTAKALGGIKTLQRAVFPFGASFTTNQDFTNPNRQVVRLTDDWNRVDEQGGIQGIAYDVKGDSTITDEKEMVRAILNFADTTRADAQHRVVPETFVPTYANNLALRAFIEFIEEARVNMTDVRERARANVRRESAKLLEEIRQQYEQQYLDMMAEGEEAIQQKKDQLRERDRKAHYFDMLKREMKRLEKLATRPTKKKHIEFNYMKYLGLIGSLVDITSNRRFSKANNALRDLAEEYKRLSSEEMYQNDEHDLTIYKHILEVADVIDGRAIRELSADEIKKVFDCVRAFIHAATMQNNFIDLDEARDINDAALHTIRDVDDARGIGSGRLEGVYDWWATTSLNPLREIDRIIDYHDDDPLHLLMNKLVKGEIKVNQYKMEMAQIFSEMDKNQYKKGTQAYELAKEYRKRFDNLNKNFVEVVLGGATQRITEGQKLALIMHDRGPDNMLHILNGGVLIPNEKYYKRGDLKNAYARGEIVVPSEQEIKDLSRDLDSFENWFLEKSIYYFEEYSKDLINATSLKLEGFARAEVANYYPIRVAENYTQAKSYDIATGMETSGDNLHSGMLMARTKSTLPIYLNSITQDLQRSQSFVSRYAGLAIPLRDFNRMYFIKVDNGTANGKPLRDVITAKWGVNATKYIDKMLKDLTQGRDSETHTILDTVRSKSAQAVLTLNPSVSIKQAASYPTAIAELDYKSVMRALVSPESGSFLIKKADQELIQKYTPILWARMAGMSTQEIAELSMMQNKNFIDKGIEKLPMLTDWIRKVDVATIGRLWYATQYWVDDHYKNVEKGSDEYYRIVADKFEDVVTKTQPNYSVLTRPDILRSNSSLVKAIMMFKTQPMQNFGLLFDATARLNSKIRQYKDAKGTVREAAAYAEYRAAGAKFARTLTSQVVQTAVFTGMTFLANAIIFHRWDKYKDEDLNEITYASVMEQMMWDYADSIFGSGFMIDWVEDVAEYFVRKFALDQDVQYYGISVFGIDALEDIAELADKMANAIQNGDNEKLGQNIWKFADSIAQLAGIPAENVRKLINSVLEYSADISQNRKITDLSGTTSRNYWNRIRNAYENGEDWQRDFDDMLEDIGADKAKTQLSAGENPSEIMEWISDMYVNGTDIQRDMIDGWLDEIYDGKMSSINGRIKAFYEVVNGGELSDAQEAELAQKEKQSKYDEWSSATDQAFSDFLSGRTVSLPYKKGDDGVSDQLARLYQTSGNPEAVKAFAVQELGYSASSINWTANRYWTKDLSAFD